MVINQWRIKLREKRENAGLTQEELADRSGVSQSAINHLETGRRKFTQKTLDKLLTALHIDYSDIFEANIEVVKMSKIPVFNAGAGEPSNFTDEGYPVGHASDTVLVPTSEVDEHTFGVKIHGESMSPYLNEGDIAVVVPSAELINGRLCFATWPGDEGKRLVKRYYRYGNTIVLKSDNSAPEFKDIELNAKNGKGVRIYRVKKSVRDE